VKSPAKFSSTTVLVVFVIGLAAMLGCQTTNKQPVDPYAATRIPAPPTYSYSQTILGQQPGQPTYIPPGAASTYSPDATPSTPPAAPPPTLIPVTPSPSTAPMSSESSSSVYGTLDSGATLYSTAATSSVPSTTWTAQPVTSVYNSETATRSMDVSAATATVVPAPISSATFDTWSTGTSQVVTNVVE